jgi:hypothetical protein
MPDTIMRRCPDAKTDWRAWWLRACGISFGVGTQIFFAVTVYYLFFFLRDGITRPASGWLAISDAYSRGTVSKADISEAWDLTSAAGDADGTAWFTPDAHGTARQRTSELKQSEENFRTLLTTAPVPMTSMLLPR